MFLTEISDLIVIDEIINEKKYTHFLTHCENRFFTETGFSSKIYTSKNIARILYRHKKIPINVFNILQSNHTTKIQLSNGQNISVTLFEGDQYTNNICFHFENNKTTLFYCGHFRNIYGLFRNQLCFDLTNAGIDYLYLDNTRANAEYLSSVNEIGLKLKQIMKSHPNYKIIISLPNYGYEDLLVNLLLKHQFKIFIGIHQKDILTHLKFDNYLVNTIREAQLIIRKDVVDMDCIKERYTKKHGITVRIVEYDKEVLPQNFEHIGLFQIHYSPHITHLELFALISFFQPKNLRDIYPEFTGMPKFLKDASLVLSPDKDEISNTNDTLSETNTAKTDFKTETVDSKPVNSNQVQSSQNDNVVYTTKDQEDEMNLNNNNERNENEINNNNNYSKLDLQKPKKKYTHSNDLEILKQCPQTVAKNIIQELFDEYVDIDNVGDFCISNTDNMHKNFKDIPIFNSDNSDLSKCILDKGYFYEKTKQDNEINYQETLEPILASESPRIGSKRLTTYDDKLHTPKEKHRKIILNNGIKEINASYTADLNYESKQKFNTIKAPVPAGHSKSRQNRSQITTLIKARNNRNVPGINNRTKTFQKKNTVNSKISNKLPLMDEIKNKIGSTDYSTKFSTVDCVKQKSYRRNMSKQIDYIFSDEE